jgi:hypothetical protein
MIMGSELDMNGDDASVTSFKIFFKRKPGHCDEKTPNHSPSLIIARTVAGIRAVYLPNT